MSNTIQYPPDEIIKSEYQSRPDFEYIILWMLINNESCTWSNFTEDLKFSQSTLSNKFKSLQNRELIAKPERGKYVITSEGKKKFIELTELKKSRKSRLSFPPNIILKGRNYEDIILWVINNNEDCTWSDFKEPPLSINSSSLSKNMNSLLEKGLVFKDNKKYIITSRGKAEYSNKMLKNYELDRQSILEDASKRIEDITSTQLEFFEKYNIKNDEIKFRFLNYVLKLDYSKIQNMLNSEDFSKILLFLSINHPDHYPKYITQEDFAQKFKIDLRTLDYYIYEIVEKELYLLKFFKLEDDYGKTYIFHANERLEKILSAIVEDKITKFTYLNKLNKKSLKRIHFSKIINTILQEVSGFIFDNELENSVRKFIPGYIQYLAYKIETEKPLSSQLDKFEGITWQILSEIKYQDSSLTEVFSEEEDEFYYELYPQIFEIVFPLLSSNGNDLLKRMQKRLKAKNYNEVFKMVHDEITIHPDDQKLHFLYVILHFYMKKVKTALEIMYNGDKVEFNINKYPLNLISSLILSYGYLSLGDYEKAYEISESIVDIYPEHPIVHVIQAMIYGYNLVYNFKENERDQEKFVHEIQEAVFLESDSAIQSRIYLLKSHVLLHIDQFDYYDDSISALDKAESLDPSNIDNYIMRFKVYASTDRYDESLEIIDEIIQKFPERKMDFLGKKASILQASGRIEEGLPFINSLIEQYPEYHNNLNNKLYFLKDLGREEEAIDTAQELIEKAPEVGNFRDSFGEILLYFGHYEEAIEQYKKGLELEPYGFFAFYSYVGLAECYYEIGDYKKALEYSDKAPIIKERCSCDKKTNRKMIDKLNKIRSDIEVTRNKN